MPMYKNRPCQLAIFQVNSLMFLAQTQVIFQIFTKDSGQGMLMLSIDLSISQWNLSYANRITTPLTFKLRLETVYQSSTVTVVLYAIEIDDGIIVWLGGGDEVEVMKIKRLSQKIHDFCLNLKNRALECLFLVSRANSLIYHFES